MPPPLPLPSAAPDDGVQAHLLVASHDIARLQRLLEGASQALLAGFAGADGELRALVARGADEVTGPHLERARSHLDRAVTALQFQDLAAQLIGHLALTLRHCGRLAAGDADAGGGAPAPGQNPVSQDAVHAGSVELF